jgi:hypothetical protein
MYSRNQFNLWVNLEDARAQKHGGGKNMVDVETEIVIERPVDEVASFAAAPENAPAWYKNIKEATTLGPGPLRAGSKTRFVARFLGKRMEYTYTVKRFEPGRILVMGTTDGPFDMETTYAWDAVDGGTRMRLRNRGKDKGLAKLAAPLMSAAIRRANNKDLRNLKRLLEAGN